MNNEVICVDNVWENFWLLQEYVPSLKGTVFNLIRRKTYRQIFWALKNISCSIRAGESVALIGRNGSGKTTLLKLMAGILYPDRGSIEINGKVSTLLELGAGFHPEFSGRENVYLNGIILGMTRKEIQDLYKQIVEFSELHEFMDNPIKTFSSGMYMRLGFSIAIHVNPDILLVDEVLAVGDIEFQKKCFYAMQQFKESGKTLIFVSHSMQEVVQHCDRAIWLDQGEIMADGPVLDVANMYLTELGVPAMEAKQ